MDGGESNDRAPDEAHRFVATSWTMVEEAKKGSMEALEELCRLYWYPIYAFIRRRGHDPQDAQDLTQGFFCELLQKNFFRSAERTRGKFRSFLLVGVKYYLSNQRERRNAVKRGGGHALISLDDEGAEERFSKEPSSALSPEKLFDREWALNLLIQARARLREEHRRGGKSELFERLECFLNEATSEHDYRKVAASLEMKPNSIAVAVHRIRHRFRELVREEVARTVANQQDIAGEMQHFLEVVGAFGLGV